MDAIGKEHSSLREQSRAMPGMFREDPGGQHAGIRGQAGVSKKFPLRCERSEGAGLPGPLEGPQLLL